MSLQHSGQLEPAAWTVATAAMKARAITVINDFIIFLSFGIWNQVRPNKFEPGAESGRDSRRRNRWSGAALGGALVMGIPTGSEGGCGRGAVFFGDDGERLGVKGGGASGAGAVGLRRGFFACVVGLATANRPGVFDRQSG